MTVVIKPSESLINSFWLDALQHFPRRPGVKQSMGVVVLDYLKGK